MTEARTLHSHTLREYDIRGVVGETLKIDDARAIGAAFATIVADRIHANPAICLGYDGRLTSPELASALESGMMGAGAQVTNVGLGPTPMLYFAAKTLAASAGIMVTGSHNPPDFNGFKMVLDGRPFFGEDIQALGRVAAAGEFAQGAGSRADRHIEADYVDRLVSEYRATRGLTIVWDPGNGAAGHATEELAKRLPGRHTVINGQVDGTFPAHHPDPTVPENLVQIIEAVRSSGADLGIAFDGDGDRIGVVDGDGRILWGDQILALLAADVLVDLPGATIIADVKASQALFDEIAARGGEPLMWKTGHSPIKQKMVETGAPLAGEMSGHIFFADRYYGYDDALYAAVRLLDLTARSDRTLAQMRDALPKKVNTPELRFPCADTEKFKIVADVRTRLEARGATLSAVDGVRVTTDDGWWLLRASNTQPVLVARCEAADDAGLGRLKAALSATLRESGVEPPTI